MKGHTNNPNGRPKGKPNRTTAEVKEFMTKFVSRNLDGLQQDLDSLDPKDRILFIEKLLQYIIPKNQSVDITTDTQIVPGEIIF